MRREAVWILLAVGLLLTGALVAGRRDSERPLDPTSARPLGTLALVTLLAELGADVDVVKGAPAGDHDVALLLSDRLDAESTRALEEWTRGGGTLVVTDPASPFAPPLLRTAALGTLERPAAIAPECGVPAVAAVGGIRPAAPIAFTLPNRATGCFPTGDGYLVVAMPEGTGSVVAVAGAGYFVNAQIGEGDNAVLAASLMAPQPGMRVAVVEPPAPGTGSEAALDLVADRFRVSLWQLVLAFVVFAIARGRRLVPLRPEPVAASLPGSGLVEAVGNLMQNGGQRATAAERLRSRARHEIAERLGTTVEGDAVVVAAANRTGRDLESVRRLLGPIAPGDDGELVALARSLEQIRSEVVDAR